MSNTLSSSPDFVPLTSPHRVLAVAVLLLCCILYYPALHGPLFFDDIPNLIDNALMRIDGRVFDDWRAAENALARTQLDDREKRARIEIASFQLQEIDQVGPVAGEDETLAAERVVLANADRLARLSGEANASLYER